MARASEPIHRSAPGGVSKLAAVAERLALVNPRWQVWFMKAALLPKALANQGYAVGVSRCWRPYPGSPSYSVMPTINPGAACSIPFNNAAERALRGIALGRKAWLFAGSDRGGERAAAIHSLIGTAKLNDVDPQAWLADVLGRINDHPASRLDELLPWYWKRAAAQAAAA